MKHEYKINMISGGMIFYSCCKCGSKFVSLTRPGQSITEGQVIDSKVKCVFCKPEVVRYE